MQKAREAASNVAATAKSGMDKTKAMAEEKAEKLTIRDPIKKEMAAEKKDERMRKAEFGKQQTYDQNAAAREARGQSGYGHTVGDQPTGVGYPSGVTTGGAGSEYPAVVDTGSGTTGGILDSDRNQDSRDGAPRGAVRHVLP